MEDSSQPDQGQDNIQVVEPIAQLGLTERVALDDASNVTGLGFAETLEVVEVKSAVNEMILVQDTWTGSVMARLHDMTVEGKLCDMILVSSDQVKVPCHTPVMVASCAYFSKILTALNQTYVNAQMTIHLSLDSSVLRQVLSFVYTGKVSVASTDLPQLNHAATFLDIPILKQLCENATKGLELRQEESQQLIQEGDIPELVEQHNAESQAATIPVQSQQNMIVVGPEQHQMQVVQDETVEHVDEHSVIIGHVDNQEDGDSLNVEEDDAGNAIIGTFEIEGAAEADSAEVLSAISRQGPLTVHVPGQSDANHSDITTWEKVFICMYCNRTFKRKDLLQSHERVHTGDRPFRCKHCSKAFKQKPHLIEHVRQHTGEKPYHCKVCDRRFAYYSHYNKHRLFHAEGGRKAFVCQYCEKSFLSPLCFAAHEREHRGERPYDCSECDQKFTLRNKLIDHQRVEHGMHSAFTCEHCQKRFANASHLKEHVRIHTGERPYICGSCSKGFKTKSTLVKHMETHLENKPYKCDLCEKSYVRESILIEHKRTHTGERPFRCEHCDMTFARQSTLINHLKIHTTGRQYRCDICSASFVRKDDCIKHVMRRHPGGQRFAHSCSVCQKAFPTKGKVKRHIERKHSANIQAGETVVIENNTNNTDSEKKETTGQGTYLFTVKKEPLSEDDSEESEEEMDTQNVQTDLGVEETVIITEVAVDSDGNERETVEEERVVHTFPIKIETKDE